MARYGSYHREPPRKHLRAAQDSTKTRCGRKGWALRSSLVASSIEDAARFRRDPNRCSRCEGIHVKGGK